MQRTRESILLAAVLLTLGCSSNDAVESTAAVTPSANTQSTAKPLVPAALQPSASEPKKAEDAKPADALKPTAATPTPADAAEQRPAVAQYQPPFPDRVDLFVPPKRQGPARVKEGETEDHVELLGFVRVDRPEVVLSVNGQIAAIPEGDTEMGVEVISIQEPKVVLQRGRQRWQASIEN
jgi:hypothetical protein